MATIKKIILLALIAFVMVGCGNNMALEGLDIVNGTKYVVTLKSKKPKEFTYNLIKVGGMDWYDYSYSDTTDFNIGDTLVITVEKIGN
jgi:predicted small secreted protein